MKKLFLFLLVASLHLSYSAKAVNTDNIILSKNAVGLRFNANKDYGLEISYQRKYDTRNRLEIDFALGLGATGHAAIAGSWQWLWNIIPSGLNLYAGPGAKLDVSGDYLGISIGGQVGIEYNFLAKNIPLLVSIDLRPMWRIIGSGPFDYLPGLGIRYTF